MTTNITCEHGTLGRCTHCEIDVIDGIRKITVGNTTFIDATVQNIVYSRRYQRIVQLMDSLPDEV